MNPVNLPTAGPFVFISSTSPGCSTLAANITQFFGHAFQGITPKPQLGVGAHSGMEALLLIKLHLHIIPCHTLQVSHLSKCAAYGWFLSLLRHGTLAMRVGKYVRASVHRSENQQHEREMDRGMISLLRIL